MSAAAILLREGERGDAIGNQRRYHTFEVVYVLKGGLDSTEQSDAQPRSSNGGGNAMKNITYVPKGVDYDTSRATSSKQQQAAASTREGQRET